MLNKKLIPLCAGLVLAFGLAACSNDEVKEENTQPSEGTEISAVNDLAPEEAVATVNGEEILQQELTNQYEQVKMSYLQMGIEIDGENEAQIKRHVLDQLVNTTLINQAAVEGGFEATEAEVQAEMDLILAEYGGEEELVKILEENNLTLASLQEEIKVQLTINKYLGDKIGTPEISQEEIEELYAQYSEQTDEMPPLEDVEMFLQEELINEKNQAAIGELVEQLKEASDIRILI
ncbi:SurA N-terminal domain-containing protein [Anaerobacillus sp. CMMVII]|uniref:SurA N-terminal domain-containing protein n=1 Tax=Anaerobacillus sp. CMMVII TaxID=2755588 RepID=UPI0021B839BF|nr:SurA N-terminal domain-containing protein [Anaerobacillus sp. CMMVII]MCT8137784.1 SurA N-terminal domain-containing protein [Anaerobacillus sp. CMMVII]